jgi:bifunctional UDP-N-acetylglucosamine pyrophosphorylase / glucosamine-1-phosphate N-acetyltransferase
MMPAAAHDDGRGVYAQVSSIATIVMLAAGLGTRMKSSLPKVMHPVCGAPLLSHVVAAADGLAADRRVVVLGHGQGLVQSILPSGWEVAIQERQRGTGDALLAAAAGMGGGAVLVLSGDTPLVTTAMLEAFLAAHEQSGAEATVLTMDLDHPDGYGRVVRDAAGDVAYIVEHRDATEAERAVGEVNAGMYVLPGQTALEILREAGTDNDQGELYITDVVAGLRRRGARVGAYRVADPAMALGVNSRVELAEAQLIMRARICRDWMLAGVTIEDPGSTHIDATVRLEPDVTILPFTCLRGSTTVGTGSEIGPGATLIDTQVGQGCRVRHAYTDGAVLEAGVAVGPFTYLRPQAHLGEGAKAGAFVEIKKSSIGRGSKVPHLSYIGDTTIGSGTNIGAGNITANYDGRHKHPTVIGDNVKTGSDTVFVAPVTIGDDATIGAGSIITKDVPAEALGIARCRQKNIEGYAGRSRGDGDVEGDGD